ncbi:YafY family transcriptional regulator [Pseudoalteromonas sp. SG45-5]|uniref:helix-turn-helix transcriptional regulator n=1 Tax=unclassified Pseudoalteromonas TaxID=194690 RepID=UPI0015FC9F91|nr:MULTISPECIES: YafY family protein [unclassified Pseudoalteromonas]MBB1387327.1 YafY family transcriptional regulator [Pseudoalteromonas sp. SG45-5]MBB1395488.1 YafY family transcriptional regulator [Pseudoalteromonas sp. SG44-4]MBB1447772.1 YafY family transcriptional regulator [Pseudoalteromonas sp. SG41-6]
MHKSERLFQLVNILKSRRFAITANELANKLKISQRTIYRDIQHLQSSGVPVEGEAGTGYLIADYDLPPMMFTLEELQALLLGSKMVSAWTDPQLAASAQAAITKINAVLPEKLKQQVEELPYLVPTFSHDKAHQKITLQLRKAITNKTCIEFHYLDVNQQPSHRITDPLGLVYWGAKWTLIAYCQLRSDYREFRLDRIQSIVSLTNTFDTNPQKNLAHYIELVKAKYQTKSDDQCHQ